MKIDTQRIVLRTFTIEVDDSEMSLILSSIKFILDHHPDEPKSLEARAQLRELYNKISAEMKRTV